MDNHLNFVVRIYLTATFESFSDENLYMLFYIVKSMIKCSYIKVHEKVFINTIIYIRKQTQSLTLKESVPFSLFGKTSHTSTVCVVKELNNTPR